MGMDNIQVPPVGMRVPITPNAKAPSSVPRKKYKDGSEGGLTMNLQEELKALKERIAELEELAKEEQEFPKYYDDYWYIDTTGDIYNENWKGFGFEEVMLEIGNVFKTKEQAEFAVEKLKVEAELRKFSRPFKRGRFNHYIFIDTDGNHLKVNSLIYGQPQGTIYFESEEKAQQAISTVGEDRIKKYIFGMEEL